ncbi:MAG TPA: hypothetical protein VLK65_22185 [Vicinamibacteria bacterium]|nr:hypothetical protein [Vicinamibacteria bacterium]
MITASLLIALPFLGPEEHVSFLVVGKTTNHRQTGSDALELLNYHFFAEIFAKEGGEVIKAELVFPDGDRQSFEDLGQVLELHGGRYDDEADLDRSYPNGPYGFRFETPGGAVERRVLRVQGTGEGSSRIPEPASISLSQNGRPVSSAAVDSDADLVVTWSEFKNARSDPNGILDDLVFVVAGDCHGEKTVHSGRPFEGTGHLDYRAKSYTISKDKLRPGEGHQMFVEHATVDTSKEDGIVGLVTYAATTFLDFETTGRPSRDPCPSIMPRIDPGQTDRHP